MAYIGRQGIIGNFVKLDSITVVNGQAAYTMQNGGSNFTDYESVNQFLVSLNGTIQAPTDSFTVSGSTLTFASNLSTGDVIDFIMVFGNSLSAGTPTDATVSTAKIINGAVTNDKVASSIINSQTAETSIADADEVLIYDSSASALRKMTKANFVSGVGGTNTPAFLAKQSGVQSVSANTTTKLNFQTEIFDTDSKFDNSTNYRFTPATAGKYFIFGQVSFTNMEDGRILRCFVNKNGSFLDPAAFVMLPGREEDQSCAIQIIDDANTTDYYELTTSHTCNSAKNTVTNSTFFGAYKIIE